MKKLGLIILVVLLSLSATILSATFPVERNSREISFDDSENFFMKGNYRVCEEDGRVVAAYSVNYLCRNDSPQQMALQYLRENASKLGLRKDLSDLRFVSSREQFGRNTVRFEQIVNGHKVFQSS
ncbi:MAG: hypothetical protein H8E57_07045, partial [Candidatus Cloacimonetes bacterium]|nr:hypothetical protein [Candidatus Cloacimonadota bacterium]